MNKQSFLNSIRQGVKDVGTVFNPVTAFNTVKQNIKSRPKLNVRKSIYNAVTPKVLKKSNKQLEDALKEF